MYYTSTAIIACQAHRAGWPGGQVADLRQLVDQVQVANAPLYFAEAEQHTAREFTVLLRVTRRPMACASAAS